MAFTTTTGAGGTSLIGTSGVDTLTVTTGLASNVYVVAEGDDDVLTVTAAQGGITNWQVYGGAGNETLNFLSSTTNSTIKGGDGQDTITLAAVNSTTVSGLNGTDTINLTGAVAGSLINGNNDVDTFAVTAAFSLANSTIAGGQGADVMNLNAAAITLTSGRVNGQDGDDTINVQLAANMSSGASINGGQGSDVITTTGAFNAIVSGDLGNDVITTAGGRDSIFGGNGADTLSGSAVNDRTGDTLTGGAGVDTFGNGIANSTLAANTAAGGTGAPSAAIGISQGASITAGLAIAFNNAGTAGATAISNGVDIITDFSAGLGGDRIDVVNGSGIGFINNAVGGAVTAANTNYAISGSYNALTSTFTVAANGQGADTLYIGYSAAAGLNDGNYYILQGTNSGTLVASNFI